MDIFEYLPQLIVAYDGNDEFANLIHAKKADNNNDYYCPCCGGVVKPKALNSTKEQSHYYHITGKCTKESQLHFFCKNWLFEEGSKFYIDEKLFEVKFIEIEKTWDTPFGDYRPDVTVHTKSGESVYFEIFFSNRKTSDDYFCKWSNLGNDVVEVNIKEYMYKTNRTDIPRFTYLYHDGVCFSKSYVKKDLYANTIAKIKRNLTRQKVLNYKARIEQLDWFWQKIRNKEPKDSILQTVSTMNYEDMISCYEIIKKKQCVAYLKKDVLNLINQNVVSTIRESLDLPYDENVFFDLNHVNGRTYEAGIRIKFKAEHIIYDDLYLHCNEYEFKRKSNYPKIVFKNNIHHSSEIILSENDIENLKYKFDAARKYREELIEFEKTLSTFEGKNYKVRMKNNLYTVLIKKRDDFEVLFENKYIRELSIDRLDTEISIKISDRDNNLFLKDLFASDEYKLFLDKIRSYDNIDIKVDIKQYSDYYADESQRKICFMLFFFDRTIYKEELDTNIDDFIKKTKECESLIQDFVKSYSSILDLVDQINNCKNQFWKAQFSFDYNGCPMIEIDQIFFHPKQYFTLEKICFGDISLITKQNMIDSLETGMKKVLKNMEQCGYRVMEVGN